jgi:hypothetical protein
MPMRRFRHEVAEQSPDCGSGHRTARSDQSSKRSGQSEGVGRKKLTRTAGWALFCLAVCADLSWAGGDVGPFTIELREKSFDERCLRLEAGQSIRYRFRASAPVDFNIHYHRGNDVIFPVKQAAVRDASSSFCADLAEDYCLMWESAGTSARIEGSVERTP